MVSGRESSGETIGRSSKRSGWLHTYFKNRILRRTRTVADLLLRDAWASAVGFSEGRGGGGGAGGGGGGARQRVGNTCLQARVVSHRLADPTTHATVFPRPNLGMKPGGGWA
jgi:hypothetical protein